MFELFGSKASSLASVDATTLRASTRRLSPRCVRRRHGYAFGPDRLAEEAPAGSSGSQVELSGSFAETSVTLKVPVAFRLTLFGNRRRPQHRNPENLSGTCLSGSAGDEGRPASSRAWSQWFRHNGDLRMRPIAFACLTNVANCLHSE